MKKNLLYIIFIFAFAACEKKTSWDLPSDRSHLIVVDGMITNEKKVHTIKLTFPVATLNDTPQPVTGAGMMISDADSVYPLTEQPANSGIYVTSSDFIGIAGHHYTLLIAYQNQIYTAKTTLLPDLSFTPLQYDQNPENDLFHITYVASPYHAKDLAIWEVLLDWSEVTGYEQTDPDSCKARLLYYTLPTLDIGQVFTNASEKISFPANTKIRERRYSITYEHAQYIRAMLSETNWCGGLFDQAHANVPTNMSDGAIGYFSACGVGTIYMTVIP